MKLRTKAEVMRQEAEAERDADIANGLPAFAVESRHASRQLRILQETAFAGCVILKAGREGIQYRINPGEFKCKVCDHYETLLHFLNNSKCWRAKQLELQKAYSRKHGSRTPSRLDFFIGMHTNGLRVLECVGCDCTIYWEGYWNHQVAHTCASCRPSHEAERLRRNEKQCRQAAKRYDTKLSKVCIVCENEFTPPRNDAKYCSAACRQAAHRVRRKTKKPR